MAPLVKIDRYRYPIFTLRKSTHHDLWSTRPLKSSFKNIRRDLDFFYVSHSEHIIISVVLEDFAVDSRFMVYRQSTATRHMMTFIHRQSCCHNLYSRIRFVID